MDIFLKNARFFGLPVVEYLTKLNTEKQNTEDRRQNGENFVIYDLLITIDYFSVASVAMSRFEKTNPKPAFGRKS